MRSVRLKANLVASVVLGMAAVLYRFPPGQYGFYPRCPIFRFTHWECPGCGATRALAALLHGRFVEALHYNMLFVLLLPVFLAYFAVAYWAAMQDERVVWPRLPMSLLNSLLVGVAAFTLARNLYAF